MSNLLQTTNLRVKSQVIQTCWEYLYDNFHKFNDTNKIKVTLAIIAKDMPTKLEGDIGKEQRIIIVRPNTNDSGQGSQADSIPGQVRIQPE